MYVRDRKINNFVFVFLDRAGHSACIVPGLNSDGNSTLEQPSSASTAIVYGGVNSVMVNSDVWALDLTWRDCGVGQLNDTMTSMLRLFVLLLLLVNHHALF
jgi:hypothetical protein